MKLKYKATLTMFLFGAFFIVSVTLSYYYYYQKTTLKNAEVSTLDLTGEIARYIESHFEEKGKIATTLASTPLFLQALTESNNQFAILSDNERKEKIARLNQRWQKSPDPNDSFIQNYLTNPVANYLKKQIAFFPEEYGEIFLTNRYGVIIATTNKLTTLAHGHKYWWLASYAKGKGRIFFDDRGYDNSVDGYVLGVVVPVIEHGQILGIMKCNINITGLLSKIMEGYSSNRHHGRTKIVRSKGLIVYEKGREPLSTSIADILSQKLVQRQSGSIIFEDHGSQICAAYSPVQITMGSSQYGFGGSFESIDHIKGNTGEGWYVFIFREVKEILLPVSTTTYLFGAVGGIFVLLAAFVSWFLGNRISQSIMRFSRIAKGIGLGKLDSTVEITSNDEIGDLATSFNAMAADINKTQGALKENLNLLAESQRVGKVGGWEFDIDSEKPVWTEETYAIHELELTDELTVEKALNFYTPASRLIMKRVVQRAIEHDEPYDVELEIMTAKGNLRTVHTIGKSDVERHRIYGYIQDITERKCIEKQLIRTQKLEATALLAGGIAHDFNNLLSVITGYVDIVLDDLGVNHRNAEALREVLRASKSAEELANRFISLSSGGTPSKRKSSVNDLIMDSVDATLSSADYQAELSLEDNLWQVEMDTRQMGQVFKNVLLNAKESMEEGGVIQIRSENISSLKDEAIDTKSIAGKQFVKIVVTDQGKGISNQIMQNIFDPYFSTKERGPQKGMGLGLTVALSIVQRHDGHMVVKSGEKVGTSVCIYLPAAAENKHFKYE